MNSRLKYTFFAVFCALFLMLSGGAAVSAQDKDSGKPPASDKTERTEKSEKDKKNPKTADGLAPVTLRDLAVDFPEVDDWDRSEIQKYPTEELGFSINYESEEGGRVTIYVYSGGKKNIPDDISDKIIAGEFSKAKNDIQKVADMGYYQNVKEVKNDTVTLGGANGKVKALRALYNLSAGGRDLTSEIYILAHQNRFIKIRATRPRDKDANGNPAVSKLLAEIDTMFAPK